MYRVAFAAASLLLAVASGQTFYAVQHFYAAAQGCNTTVIRVQASIASGACVAGGGGGGAVAASSYSCNSTHVVRTTYTRADCSRGATVTPATPTDTCVGTNFQQTTWTCEAAPPSLPDTEFIIERQYLGGFCNGTETRVNYYQFGVCRAGFGGQTIYNCTGGAVGGEQFTCPANSNCADLTACTSANTYDGTCQPGNGGALSTISVCTPPALTGGPQTTGAGTTGQGTTGQSLTGPGVTGATTGTPVSTTGTPVSTTGTPVSTTGTPASTTTTGIPATTTGGTGPVNTLGTTEAASSTTTTTTTTSSTSSTSSSTTAATSAQDTTTGVATSAHVFSAATFLLVTVFVAAW